MSTPSFPDKKTAETIFGQAIQHPAAEDRAAFLEEQCGDDPALLCLVRKLVDDFFRAGDFLEPPDPDVQPYRNVTVDQSSVAEKVGETIGWYRLGEQIGEGGMGVVYAAEQYEPVKRKVALKIIKPGMASRDVLARFEAERQVLAIMDHPNIAKVLDAGTTDTGRPYFVMELVNGQPITRYCDQQRLAPRERLELFVTVCHAIQHAHQKGIIHRDIKPSNVLVADCDGRPVAKVIDFGVAKAIRQPLTERTMVSGLGQMIGTLEYMSPEQSRMDAPDIDTRSDVYSLGVLLYELLTGCTPFEGKRLRSAAFDEMLRIIREEDPPRPSTRLSSSDALPSIAANRNVEPARLGRTLRGELDWLVMKALEKDRNRRYETAIGFAEDLQRYLADEPVQACPPSAAYRLRKFARRHRGPVLASLIVLLTLVAGVIGTTFGLVRAEQARSAETKRADAEQQARLEALQREAETNAVLDFLELGVLSDRLGESEGIHGDLLLSQAIEGALPFVSESVDEPLIEGRLRLILGLSSHFLNRDQIAGQQVEQALALFERHGGQAHPGTLASMDALAEIYFPNRLPEVRKHQEAALSLRKARLGTIHPDTLWTMLKLAHTLDFKGQTEEANRLREEVGPLLVQAKVRLDQTNSQTPKSLKKLADCYGLLNRHQDATHPLEEALTLERAMLGDSHPMLLPTMYRLGLLYMQYEPHYAEGFKLSQEMLQLCQTQLGSDHSRTLAASDMLASFHSLLGQQAEAERIGLETYAIRSRLEATNHATFGRLDLLADELARDGRYAQAESQYRRTLERTKKILQSCGRGVNPELEGAAAATAVKLGELLLKTGRTFEGAGRLDEAAALYDHWTTYNLLTNAHARQRRWNDAAAAAQRCVELEPSMCDAWLKVALLAILTGEMDGYRHACRHLLNHFCEGHEFSPHSNWEITRVCSLAPDSVADFSRVEQLVASNLGEDAYAVQFDSLVKGLVEYRAGRIESAVRILRQKPIATDGPWVPGAKMAVLAMAYHQSGEAGEAQESLESARVAVELEPAAPRVGRDSNVFTDDWRGRAVAEVLYREASALLSTK